MQRTVKTVVGCAIALAVSAGPAMAQLPGKLGKAASQAKDTADKAKKAAEIWDAFNVTEAEEVDLGRQVSDKLRERYGVVQDKAVHKYVTLVGTMITQASSRPGLAWKFIVLDTDGVNAYAAPGGFVHITRGALSLLTNEAELAGVLGHEVAHVTERHTINAIKKSKGVELTAEMSRSQVLSAVADKSYEILFEGMYNRGDELDADAKGAVFANAAGYAPGLGAFLQRLSDRNKGQSARNGLFASHPETKERIDKLGAQVVSRKFTSKAQVAARFKTAITYTPVPMASITQVEAGSAGLAGGKSDGKAAPASGGGKLGLGTMSALGGEKKSTSTIASAGARGGLPDRDAKGGGNATIVTVTVSAAEVADFKRGIA
jgi:predicted Zn-dependent protease